MDVNMNVGWRDSSQEPLLSDNEYFNFERTLKDEIPMGILNDLGLCTEEEEKIIPWAPTMPINGQDATGTSPTCEYPCIKEWAGPYSFELMMNGMMSSKKTWLFSHELNKIFVDRNQIIPLQFKIENRCEDDPFFVRAVAIYNVDQHLHIPVRRCPNHLKEDEDKGLANKEHVVQCSNKSASYECDNMSNRFSVLVPLDYPPAGSDVTTLMYLATCKGSCLGGMNRRPVTLIFTLERANREVVGRRILDIRVCSCPKRDKKKEEMEGKEETNGAKIYPSEAGRREEFGAQIHPPDQKKRKLMKPKQKKGLISTCGEPKLYNIQVSGTKKYCKVLDYLVMLESNELVETNSPASHKRIEEYKGMLEIATRESS